MLEQVKRLDGKGHIKMGVHADTPGTSLSHRMVLHINLVTKLFKKNQNVVG